ncbi:MAG TPA: methyltransferase domain-containing protein [Bryobacteraceae bacterium]|nr:methyltransferase domain-containing protein [Bryobacteraceae bacterium]
MNVEAHWEAVYGAKRFDQVSWFRPHLETSIALIERATQDRSARIIDVGGGESTLVDDLIALGYRNLTVLDVSQTALRVTQERLGERANHVEWIAADITTVNFPSAAYDVWHDRAVFHFLTDPDDRAAYIDRVTKCVKPGGHVIIGTFGVGGPLKCSGLYVRRYDSESLHGEFGKRFRLMDSVTELHETPFGTTQRFLYCFCLVEEWKNAGRSSVVAPILDHPVEEASAFTAEALMSDARQLKKTGTEALPSICFLDFDGDLTDWLVERGIARPFDSWACFHTTMFWLDLEGVRCGIVARTIGGPFAVLIAEQLRTAGVSLIVGLTSAGRVAPELPLPGLVVASAAIRDEGTSYHYLRPQEEATCPSDVTEPIARELRDSGFAVRTGKVWTTDAPYRETSGQLQKWAEEGALAVEMQAASLFAFGRAQGAKVAVVARVSNAVDHDGQQFDTGSNDEGLMILQALARAGLSILQLRTQD